MERNLFKNVRGTRKIFRVRGTKVSTGEAQGNFAGLGGGDFDRMTGLLRTGWGTRRFMF